MPVLIPLFLYQANLRRIVFESSRLTLAFLVFLTYATTLQGWQALQHGETTGTALNWPIPAYLKTLFAVCAAIMAVQTTMHVVEDAQRVRRRTGLDQN